MKRYKYYLTILGLVFLISLAVIGVGLTGAAPTFFKGNKREKEEDQIELSEEKEDKKDVKEIKLE